jgi:putative membrane protein
VRKYLYGAVIVGGLVVVAGAVVAQQTHQAAPSQPAASTTPPPAQAAAPAEASSGNQGRLSAADQKFVESAAIGGLYEVEAGRIAEKSANRQVKQFGARMVRDHGAANTKLKQIVTAQGGTVPQSLDQDHQQQLDQLRKLHGPEFAQAYMQNMVKDHDTDAQEFGQAAQSLDDPQLKSFAQQTLKVIETHDKMAHQITDKMAAK